MRRYACLSGQLFRDEGREIRPVQDEDIESIRLWRNAQIDVLRQKQPITPEGQISYYQREIWPTMALPQPDNLLVSYLNDGKLIGYGGLVHIAWEHRRAEVSFLVDPVRAGDDAVYRKDFSLFLQLIKRLAFDDLGFNRIFTESYAIRPNHMATLDASGFQLEGALKQHVIINGTPVDALIHGCLRSNER